MSNASFYRAKKEKCYTVLDNTCLRDGTLSWKARGIMAYLLSLPEDWDIYLSEVETHATDGRDSLMSGIKELKDHGYIVVTKTRNSDGTFENIRYNIIENPGHPQTDFPYTDKPDTVKPITDNPQLLNTDLNKVLNKLSTDNISPKPETRHRHGEYSHVLLTEQEYSKLLTDWGKEKLEHMIQVLDEGIEAKGYKYKNFALALRTWDKNQNKHGYSSQRQSYSQPKHRVEQGVQRVTGEAKQIHVDLPDDIF